MNQALYWYKRSSDQGHKDAQYNLAIMEKELRRI
jgi:TPR repeat protein